MTRPPDMHTLLRRQLKRHVGDVRIPPVLGELLDAVDQAYHEFDDDRLMLERSLELSSRELLQANSEMRAIFRALPDLFFLLDADGVIIDCKGGCAEDFFLPPDELLGKRIQDVPTEAVATGFEEAIRSIRAAGASATFEYELPMEGLTTYHEARLIPLHDGQILAIVRNVTKRRHAEERLTARTEQVQRHGRALQELALLRNRNLRQALARISEVAARTLDVDRVAVWLHRDDRSTLIRRHVHDRRGDLAPAADAIRRDAFPRYFEALEGERVVAVHDLREDPRVLAAGEDGLHGGPVRSSLDVSIRLHGTGIGVISYQSASDHRTWSPNETNFGASVADLVSAAVQTDRRRMLEEQLRQSQKMEAVGLLAGGIAHDFNNLLNVILGYCDLARSRTPLSHAASGHLEKVSTAAIRAADLTRKLLTVSRKHVVKLDAIEVNDLLDDFDALLARIVGEDIEVEISRADRPLVVRADRAQLDQVLLNLCTNARQAMPYGGRLTVETSCPALEPDELPAGARPGEYVRLRVADTGVGMSDDVKSRLWEPFFTTKSDGTGLGLAMVYGIVEQHDGFVTVDSEPGHGSRFDVWLPLLADTVLAEQQDEEAVLPLGSETILVAEDEALLRDLVATCLADLGYDVIVAENGREAVESFERHSDAIDVAILDVVMPKMSGPDAYRRMRARRPGTKALFVTGYAPDTSRLAEVLEDDHVDVLVKPFRMEELAWRLRQIIESGVPR